MKTKLLYVLTILSFCVTAEIDSNVKAVLPKVLKDYPNVRDFTINASKNEAYFTAQSILGEVSVIMRLKKTGTVWQKPEIASFSGKHHDLEPFLSKDGLKLFFASKRPNYSSDQANYDIWFVNRSSINSKWLKPQNMGPQINSRHNEFYPSIAHNNNFYFTSNKDDSKGKDDIYFSEFNNGHYLPSISLSQSINSPGDEYNAFISPEDSYLIFGAYNREDGTGSGDLYVSYKRKDSTWSSALKLPEPINSKYMDYCPFVLDDTLYFTSRRSEFEPNIQSFKTTKKLISQINKSKNGLSRIYKISLKNTLPKY